MLWIALMGCEELTGVQAAPAQWEYATAKWISNTCWFVTRPGDPALGEDPSVTEISAAGRCMQGEQLADGLNALGAEGWELETMAPDHLLIFKRRK